MSAHTPGPWTVPHFARPEVGCSCRYVFANGFMGSVATVDMDNGRDIECGGNDSPPREVAKANARLMSASPTMLSALYAAREALDNYSDVNDGEDGQPVANTAMKALMEVDAAIAKAEGAA